jgi:hypothetical protein
MSQKPKAAEPCRLQDHPDSQESAVQKLPWLCSPDTIYGTPMTANTYEPAQTQR